MGPQHTAKNPAPTNLQWGVIHAAVLTLSATCVLLAVGCAPTPYVPYVVGLKPESPFVERESQVDRLRPTLRWERFPRAKDREELGPHAGERIAAVSYEVRLWKVGKEFPGISNLVNAVNGMQRYFDYKYSWGHGCRDADPGELVYRQQGLVQPEHTLEIPLQPNSFYFWTVRAHFTLDGKRRATEWSEQLIIDSSERFEGREHGCSSPATFHLIRTP